MIGLPRSSGGKPQFRIGGIPVRIDVTFFIFAFIFGYSADRPSLLFYWIPIALVSILFHEFGHAIAAKSFGDKPVVTVHGMGGLTTFSPGHSRAQLLTISLAGPLSALLLLGIPSLMLRNSTWTDQFHDPSGNHYAFATLLVWVNVYWSLVNLLPILPLDGGAIFSHLFGAVRAQQVSVVTAGAAAWFAFANNVPFAGFIAVMFGFLNFASLRARRPQAPLSPDDVLAQLERAYIPGPPVHAGTTGAVADRGLVEPLTDRLLQRGAAGVAGAHTLASQLLALGRATDAAAVLERVYSTGLVPPADAALAAARAWAGPEPERALLWVDRALDHGLADAQALDADPWLAPVRALPAWPQVRGRLPL